LFNYCCDNCNNAGFIEIDLDAWAFPISCNSKELEGAWKGLSRGFIVSKGWAFIRNFLKHQKHLPLMPERNPAHKQILALFVEQSNRFPNLLDKVISGSPIEGACEGLNSPIGKGKGKGKGEGTGEGEGEAKTPRPRNMLMDALAECDGDPLQIPSSAWGRIAKALAEIKAVCPDVTPEEIKRRAANYKTHFGANISLTSTALVKHWAKCDIQHDLFSKSGLPVPSNEELKAMGPKWGTNREE
jgi:hypothetical protein